MNTTTFTGYDSPENLRARRKGLEVLPLQAQRRVGVLGFALRASEAMPGSIDFTSETTKFIPSVEKVVAPDAIVTPKLEANNQQDSTAARSILDEAYRMLSDAWSKN